MRHFLAAMLLLAGPAAAEISGTLRVIDGDTFALGDTTIRLFGIDAFEAGQTCTSGNGEDWPCGEWVTAQVSALVDGLQVSCAPLDIDQYGRTVARCHAGDRDLAEAIVLRGLAVAYREYSLDYDLAEKQAQVTGAGVWSGTFETPSAWRSDRREELATRPAQVSPDAGCVIKGNISSSGQVYHQPHNRDYAATRIDTSRGERWFCTPSEAEAAGWRPARN